jgi:hypothetical protein
MGWANRQVSHETTVREMARKMGRTNGMSW